MRRHFHSRRVELGALAAAVLAFGFCAYILGGEVAGLAAALLTAFTAGAQRARSRA